MKKLFFLFLIFCSIHCFGGQIRIYTLPKSGTFLLKKIFEDLLKTDCVITHVYDFPLSDDQRGVVVIRDLRDVFLSTRNFFNKVSGYSLRTGHTWPNLETFDYRKYTLLSEDKKLRELLEGHPLFLGKETRQWIDTVSIVLNLSNVLIVRFEDFIGRKGGGDDKRQRETFLKIFDWFKTKVDQVKLDYALNHFWGDSITFHKGQIGSRKNGFTREHIQTFKKHWNHYLIQWGYETKEDWGL